MNSRPRISMVLSRWFSLWLGLAMILCALEIGRAGIAQNVQPEWAVALRTLQARRDAVGTIKAEYLLEYSLSPELEKEYEQADAAALERAKANGDVTANSITIKDKYDLVSTCRYQRKGDLWREDVSEVYPGGPEGGLLDHFQGFDGEKYFAYDATRSHGIIAPTALDIRAVTGPYANVSNGIRFLGLSEPVDSWEEGQKMGATVRLIGQEQVNGEQCVKYLSKSQAANGLRSRSTIWISPNKGYAVIKWEGEVFAKNPQSQLWNVSLTVGNTFALEKTADGTYVNKVFEQDEFTTKHDGKLHWERSWRFTLANLQLGAEIPRSTFAAQFPPGARIVDSILSPGRINVVGAEYGMAAEQMSKGIKIKPEALSGTSAPQPQPGEEFTQLTPP